MTVEPQLTSLALQEIPVPDFADVAIGVWPPGAPVDPAVWARTLFSPRGAPLWVGAALAIRQLLAPLVGIRRAPEDVFSIARTSGQEALIVTRDTHLDFACAIGVDPDRALVRVTTTVKLHGRTGRIYFAPVRMLHPIVVQAMLAKTRRVLNVV